MNRAKFYADLLERTAWSFVAGFAGGYLGGAISGQVHDLSMSARVSIGVGAGLVSVFKGLAAVQLPWTAPNSASVLPEKLDLPAPVKSTARARVRRDDGWTTIEICMVVIAGVLVAWAAGWVPR